jgi:putative endonuclease
MDRKELGRRGEAAAAAYLVRTGMEVAATNWRSAAGEVDIVAWDGPDLVLVEVKTRRSERMGTPE